MNEDLKNEILNIGTKENLWTNRKKNVSEKDLTLFKSKVNWYYICDFQKLSESFIEKFQDKVYWLEISKYQTLSESFIEKHSDKVYWHYISASQKLSEQFIEKFQKKLDTYEIINKIEIQASKYDTKDEPHIEYNVKKLETRY